MNDDLLNEVEAAETSWKNEKAIVIPNIVLEEAPLTEWAVKAHNIFAGQVYDHVDALACRIADVCPMGVNDENFTASEPVAAACKKLFTNVKKLKDGLKRPALDWGNAVEKAYKETVAYAEPTLNPIIEGVKRIKDAREKAKEEAKQAKIEAERQAVIAAENLLLEAERQAEAAKRAAEAEANRVEQARLLAEREALEADRKKAAEEQARLSKELNDKLAAERSAFEAEQKIANDKRLEAERKTKAEADAKLAGERAKFDEERRLMAEQNKANQERIAAELAERERIDRDLREFDRIERQKVADELAEFKRQKAEADQLKAEAEAEKQRQAAAEAARLRKEAADKAEAERLAKLAPDIDKIRLYGESLRAFLEAAPKVSSDEAKAVIQRAVMDLSAIANDLQKFGGPK